MGIELLNLLYEIEIKRSSRKEGDVKNEEI